MSTEMNDDVSQLMSSGGAPFPHQRNEMVNGHQLSTPRFTAAHRLTAHNSSWKFSETKFPFEMRLCGCLKLQVSHRVSAGPMIQTLPESDCASTPMQKMWHILLHRWRLEPFRGCVFRCEFARYDRDTIVTELASTLIQHLADHSQLIIKLLSPCRVMAACNANLEKQQS